MSKQLKNINNSKFSNIQFQIKINLLKFRNVFVLNLKIEFKNKAKHKNFIWVAK